MALVKAKSVLVAAGTSCVVGTPVRGTLDVRTASGGRVTMKITNGATAPTVQAVGRVLVAHDTGATPAAAAAGANWKTIPASVFGSGSANNAVTEFAWEFGPETQHIEVEFAENTVQNVTVEAECTTYSYE